MVWVVVVDGVVLGWLLLRRVLLWLVVVVIVVMVEIGLVVFPQKSKTFVKFEILTC